jgi:hypothetical protein
VLDELAESVADEETKNAFGKWDPQVEEWDPLVEESLSRMTDESHQQGMKPEARSNDWE